MRIRGAQLGVIALLGFGLVILPGCKSGKAPAKKPSAKKPSGKKPAGKQPAGKKPAPKDGQLSDKEKKALAVVKDAAANIDKHVKAANAAIAKKDWPTAESELAKAKGFAEKGKGQLTPANEKKYVPQFAAAVKAWTMASSDLAKKRGAEAGNQDDLGGDLAKQERVTRQRIKTKAETNFKNANAALKAKKYDDAIKYFNVTLETIRWAPYKLGLDAMAANATKLLNQAKREQRAAKIRQEQEQIQRIKAAERAQIERLRKMKRDKIDRLFELALSAFRREDFSKSEELANEILKEDPLNKVARRLHEDSVESRHEKARLDYIQEKVERWRRFRNDMLESRTPYASLIRFPDAKTWQRVSRRQIAGDAAKFQLVDSEEVRKIKSQLETKRITLDFTDTPFEDVVQFIQQVTQVNIVIDQDAKTKLSEGEGTVTLNVKDIRLKDALTLLLQVNELTYTFKEGVLFITTPDSEANKGSALAKIHDIRDLTAKINDFTGPNISLSSAGSGGGTAGAVFETGEDTEPAITKEALVELLQGSISPDSWEDEKYSLDAVGGQLLVVHTPEVHAQINNFLNDLRQFAGLMVHVETRFVEVTDDFLQNIGVDWRGLGDNAGSNVIQPFARNFTTAGTSTTASFFDNTGGFGSPTQGAQATPFAGFFSQNQLFGFQNEVRARTQNINRRLGGRQSTQGGLAFQAFWLTGDQYNMVLTAVRKSTSANVVSAPRITVFNTQRAYIAILNQFSYIKDYDVEIAANSVAADPEIGTVQDGLVLDVRPTVSHDRRYVTLELRPTVSFLVRPIPQRNISLGGSTSSQVRIQVPNITLHSAETTVRVPDKGAVVIGGLKNILIQDLRAEIPILAKIPIVSFFFSQKGKAEELRNLIIIARATIIDLQEEEEKQRGRDVTNR